MKKLVPLFAILTTACGPATLDRDLKDIPGPTLYTQVSSVSDHDSFSFGFDWDRDSPCYRIPEDTRFTVNGDTFSLEERGESVLSFDGAFYCRKPSFKGPLRPASEARTEIVLSDGHSSKRAVFQELRAERRIRVNGQEQATVHAGAVIDIEWLPATDRLSKVDVSLEVAGPGQASGSREDLQVEGNPTQVEGNHIRYTLPQMRPGRYVVSVYGQGSAGVEACEGFISCTAELWKRVEVTVVVE
ncbi:hypothetical protein JRI60_13035 [Archangium violaceum]|uniref:hypothetical protein n=1 Tax=Archangium violaceum TaxID=83451 RepID=UPI0019508283|nr:hypothetical protein [Archangium violaceum]QRN99880.1 hypothetical protein JRI60_13035 [Archangium violaceum]